MLHVEYMKQINCHTGERSAHISPGSTLIGNIEVYVVMLLPYRYDAH